ncbi:hypothetical protein MIS46_05380 [Wielerella bovis]|uniref:hypothetical protein n=1 Tax=Wielerella bovis TaxID=2917790 RepID=UPI00201A0FEE|nr:hypothetical protein [Wielerella bovis]ULJ63478.1 hypothetical protein MIS46_05380 [Wielerella bovis]
MFLAFSVSGCLKILRVQRKRFFRQQAGVLLKIHRVNQNISGSLKNKLPENQFLFHHFSMDLAFRQPEK